VKLEADVPLNFTLLAVLKFAPFRVISEPATALAGVNEEMTGVGGITTKSVALSEVPPGVVTLIFPSVAPAGTLARICVFESTKIVEADVSLNFTSVAPAKLVPVIVICVPTTPLVGVNEAMDGPESVKSSALRTVPPATVTLILPVVVPAGTLARICVAESTVKVEAAVPLNFTELAPVKLLPVIVTSVPTNPLTGVKEVKTGVSVKSSTLNDVPPAVVTLILPLVVPEGTFARICVAESTIKAAGVPLNFTLVVLMKPVPMIVISVPTKPLVGEKEPITEVT
jgi:hypothetical protein